MNKLICALLSNNLEKIEKEHKNYGTLNKIKTKRMQKNFQLLEINNFLKEKNLNKNLCDVNHIREILLTILNNKKKIESMLNHINYINYYMDTEQTKLTIEYIYDNKYIIVALNSSNKNIDIELYEYYNLTNKICDRLPVIYKYDFSKKEFELVNFFYDYYKNIY